MDDKSISSSESVKETSDSQGMDNESLASSATTQGSYEVRDEPQNDDPDAKAPRCHFVVSSDLVAVLSTLLMHDGPFLIFRLVLLFKFEVTSEIHLFFTAKNALTVAIMLYRLYILVHASRVVRPEEGKQDRKSSRAAAA
jgi:hypothetical protein